MLIRLSALGDVVMASPLIHAFRRAYPTARLAWLGEWPAAALVQGHPDLDEVIIWPRSEWRRLWRARRYLTLARQVRAFARELRARRFDLAVDLQGLLKSALWAWASGARERIGLGSREGSGRLMTRVLRRQGDHPRIGSEYYALAAELGLPREPFEMTVSVGSAEEAFATRFKADLHPPPPATSLGGQVTEPVAAYAVICPFTTRPQKHWLAERWSALAQRLTQEQGLRVVMLGGPGDVTAAPSILATAPHIVSMVGQCTVRESAALIKHAALVIGVDTGLTHMGIAFGVPTVALFGSTRPYLDTTRRNARVLYEPLACSPCRRRPTCGGEFTCMRLHTVDAVNAATRQVRAA